MISVVEMISVLDKVEYGSQEDWLDNISHDVSFNVSVKASIIRNSQTWAVPRAMTRYFINSAA